jgi:hypothetical protein
VLGTEQRKAFGSHVMAPLAEVTTRISGSTSSHVVSPL